MGRGDGAGADVLLPRVYAELKAIALRCMRGQARDHTLQPTALVHEAYLKLFDTEHVSIVDRGHFFHLAARAMRQLLIDHARQRRAQKRGGAYDEQTLDESIARAGGIEFDWLDLDQALVELAARDERQARVVELRYFCGLEVAEVAAALDLSVSGVEREWRTARAWLGMRLKEADRG